MITKIKKMYPVVEALLEQYPATRDNDRLLIVKVWEKQSPYLDTMFTSFAKFKTDFLQGKFANTESIRRSRQLVQEKREDLRGKFYGKRKEILAPEVRNEIKRV